MIPDQLGPRQVWCRNATLRSAGQTARHQPHPDERPRAVDGVKAPGEGDLDRGLSVPGESRGSWGNAASIISLAVICSSQAKEAQEAGPSAPLLSFPKCPHTREEKIGNEDD